MRKAHHAAAGHRFAEPQHDLSDCQVSPSPPIVRDVLAVDLDDQVAAEPLWFDRLTGGVVRVCG